MLSSFSVSEWWYSYRLSCRFSFGPCIQHFSEKKTFQRFVSLVLLVSSSCFVHFSAFVSIIGFFALLRTFFPLNFSSSILFCVFRSVLFFFFMMCRLRKSIILTKSGCLFLLTSYPYSHAHTANARTTQPIYTHTQCIGSFSGRARIWFVLLASGHFSCSSFF